MNPSSNRDDTPLVSLPRTARELKVFLQAQGLRPRRRFGQNFMIDANLIDSLVRAAHIEKGDRVLEVGMGTGLLTLPLLNAGAEVVTWEMDRRLFEVVGPRLQAMGSVKVLCGDVLKHKNQLSPHLLEAIQNWGTGGYKVVSNLPYNASVPFVVNLLQTNYLPERMVVTLQKEVADRFLARAGEQAYGRISVEVQLRATVQRIRNVPPEVFWPRPEVRSTVLEIFPVPDGMQPRPRDESGFGRFLEAVFTRRRKRLPAALGRPGQVIEEVLKAQGLNPRSRGEDLNPEELVSFHDALHDS